MTGIVVGPFFSVAYYAPLEWNRRITGECNRAMGIVKTADGKTEVSFIRSKGLLSPFWFLGIMAVVLLSFFLVVDSQEWQSGAGTAVWYSFLISATICGFTALEACLTEQGAAGEWDIDSFLTNPREYF